MNKNVLALAVLVSILLVINTTFIVIIQSSKSDSNKIVYVGETIGNVLSGYDQLEMFNKPVIESSLAKKTTTRSTSTIIKKPKPEPTPTALRSPIRTVLDDNGRVIYTVNYDTDTITFPDGKTTPIIIDGNVNPSQNDYYDATTSTASTATVDLNYPRFTAHVEQNYYNANAVNITDFLDKLAPRFALMEQTTGWSSEKFGNGKLDLYIDPITSGCWNGYAIPGEMHLKLSNPFYLSSCNRPYYENGQQKWNNPGELGDKWIYWTGGLHEAMHSINPLPVYSRLWLTEGFSEYNMYNILTANGDINQETSDSYIYQGSGSYNWQGYVNNDYKDTAGSNNEIQNSQGYDITAWMFSMLKDNWGLNWNRFYSLVNNNLETLNKADAQTNWQISDDMVVLDLFGRTLGRDFNGTKFIFRYDGPSGPGWGVRQWISRDFYGDLRTNMNISNINPQPGDTIKINVTVYNDGQTNLNNVSLRIYTLTGTGEDPVKTTIKQQTINVNAGQSILIQTDFTSVVAGGYGIVAYADNSLLKLETNEDNNAVIQSVYFGTPDPNASCPWEKVNGHWVQSCSSQAIQIK